MTTYPPAGQKITRDGKTLTARMWALLEAAYDAAGAPHQDYLHVSQGSFRASDPNPSSGTTHNYGGAADLRTWNLPAAVQADLARALVVELRKRGGCAWYRDQAHGGFDPHIHVIVRDEPDLSSSAAWQVSEYDAGRDGLSAGGPDYHPRPTQVPFTYPPGAPVPGDPDTPTEGPTMLLIKVGANAWRLITGDRMIGVSPEAATAMMEAKPVGVSWCAIPKADADKLAANLVAEGI